MSSRSRVTTTYDPERIIQPIYTGGDIALDEEGRILATCLGEEVALTALETGELLARIEGVCPSATEHRTTLRLPTGWRGPYHVEL